MNLLQDFPLHQIAVEFPAGRHLRPFKKIERQKRPVMLLK